MRLCAFADEASKQLSEQITALQKNNISLIEIRGVNGKNIVELTPSEVRAAKNQLNDAGISVWSIGSPIGKIRIDDDHSKHFDDFLRICESAELLGANRIRIFSFYPCEDGSIDLDTVLERLDNMLHAAPVGIRLCHENEKGIYGSTALHCAELLSRLPALSAVYDPANFVQCNVDTLAAWRLLSPYVDYIHIKDALPNGSVVPAGLGVGHVREIIEAYLDQGGDVITCEPHLKAFSGLSRLELGELTQPADSKLSQLEAFELGVNSTKAIIDKLEKNRMN